jgi:hypothetical protein
VAAEQNPREMRLDKLRGYGPWFAFGVPFLFLLGLFLVVVVNGLVPSGTPEAPGWLPFAIALWLLLWAVIILAGLVVAVDLEWIEHPRTNTPLTYVGLGGMVVATLGFIVFLLEGLILPTSFEVGQVTAFAVFAGFGVYLLVMNFVGLRAGLLGAVLPWLGIVSGALFLFAAVMVVLSFNDTAGLGYVPGWAIYLAWSLWLGFRLRGNAPEIAKAPA